MLVLTNLAFIAVLGASATFAQPNQQTPAPDRKEVAAGATVAEKKICKRLPGIGTRIEKTACLTRKQWIQVEAGDVY
jgi:hypothetical protein